MLIIGLGNPGIEYTSTRHNIGRDFLFELVDRGGFSPWKNDRYLKSFVSEKSTSDSDLYIIALPETFMNRSGEAVRALVKKYNLEPQEVVVVYDDLDLPVGSVKISKSRGDGGHNGVKSIINHLGSNDFIRIRIGICPTNELGEKIKPRKGDVSRFVLGRFSPSEKEKLSKLSSQVPLMIGVLRREGIGVAMNLFNKK